MMRRATLFRLACLVSGATQGWHAEAATTNTVVFLETMATATVKPWSGAYCNNPWTVLYGGSSNPFEQNRNANYGSGNTNGLAFIRGTTNLNDSVITTTQGLDARGNSGTLGFYVNTSGLTNGVGWALQLNPGSGFTTRLTETNGSNHAWQSYSYSLQAGDLVSNLTLRFQFSGSSTNSRIWLDQISLTINIGTNATTSNLPDTGQTTGYTTTFGEDADLTIHPPAFADNGDGTISDKVTGLMWQQTDGGEMLFGNATNYPATVTLGGFSDWRLPTSHELFGLANHGAFSPALNTNFFTDRNNTQSLYC